jgi:uncharacterized protein (DUF2336 family)
MSSNRDSLISELELAVSGASPQNRVNTLRRVTDLFLIEADRLNDEQIRVFDDVLCRLVAKIERRALSELGMRLAPVDRAPVEIINRLARDEEILIARPVLTQSNRLTSSDLIAVAELRGQAHLLAISEREQIDTSVTDVLLSRGDREVVQTLAKNSGAQFSEHGMDILVRKAEGDEDLTEAVGLRGDLPQRWLQELLQRATDTVRSKILLLAPPELRETIQRVIQEVAQAFRGFAAPDPDFADAELLVGTMEKNGMLNESSLMDFIKSRKYAELTVALARLSSATSKTVSGLLTGQRNDAVLIPCRAANLGWPTVEALLRNRFPRQTVSEQVIELAKHDYAKLSVATAQRTLRFLQVRDSVK